MNNILRILRSMAPSCFEPDCVTVKNYFGKVMQTEFAFKSLLSFADCEISGVMRNYRLQLNHQ